MVAVVRLLVCIESAPERTSELYKCCVARSYNKFTNLLYVAEGRLLSKLYICVVQRAKFNTLHIAAVTASGQGAWNSRGELSNNEISSNEIATFGRRTGALIDV